MLFDLSFDQGTNQHACLLEFMSVGQILHGNRILLMLIQVFNSLRTSYSYHVAIAMNFKINLKSTSPSHTNMDSSYAYGQLICV